MGAILVTGATGQQGGEVARELLRRGHRVRALTRDPDAPNARDLAEQGAEPVRGDLDDRDSLAAAMSGVDGVFSVQTFMTPGGLGREVRQGKAVADAAKAGGVNHVVYSSVGGAERDSGVPHFDSKRAIERHLDRLGLNATVLRPTFFMDNFATHGPTLVDGTLTVQLALRPDTRVQLVSTADIGWFAAEAFEQPDEYIGTAVELAGDELTATQLARAFQDASGTPARFEELPLDAVAASPYIPYAPEIALMFEWFQEAGYRADITALRARHPGLRTMADWLRETNWQPTAPAWS